MTRQRSPSAQRLSIERSTFLRLGAGLTLLEVLIALTIGGVVAAGTMSAYVAAVRVSRSYSITTTLAEFAQQPMERNRNLIALRLPGQGKADAWYDETGQADPPTGWTSDSTGLPMGMSREYQVTKVDCGGAGGPPGDCLQMEVKVQQ